MTRVTLLWAALYLAVGLWTVYWTRELGAYMESADSDAAALVQAAFVALAWPLVIALAVVAATVGSIRAGVRAWRDGWRPCLPRRPRSLAAWLRQEPPQ